MDHFRLDLKQTLEDYRSRKVSPTEVVRACLERISATDDKINAFITVFADQALKEARVAETKIFSDPNIWKDLPLLGVPVSIKDNFCTKGGLTTAASRVLDNFIPLYDATVVARLRRAGAVILGKTNLDAWAHGSSTETSDFFTTRNPWDLDRLPGGSSGGSAASVAAQQTIISIGSETAGSIRQPAAWCGVCGLKPSYGRVSRSGLIAMASSLDCPGPVTKSVWDAATVLKVIAGQDSLDATTSPQPVPDYPSLLDSSIKGITVALPQEYFASWVNTEVLSAVSQAVEVLRKLGVKVKKISLFDPQYAIAVYTILQRSEVSSNLARYDGIRYGHDRNHFGQEAKRRIMLGSYALSAGYYDKYYRQALKVRTKICQDFNTAFQEADLILGPVSPSPALPVGAAQNDPMFGEKQDILLEPSAIAGLPGISLPCGFSKEGLPVSFQIIGPRLKEELVLRLAYAYQQVTDWHKQFPTIKLK